MNNPNPFLSPVSLLEQKNKKRARVKVAVFSIFAGNILLISPLLIQGCKDKQPASPTDATVPATNDTAAADASTNVVPPSVPPLTNPVVPPVAPPVVVVPPTPTVTEYVVVKGDSFSKIAHDHGIPVKALEAANPGIDPAKLQIGKKLQLPPPMAPAISGAAPVVADSADMYVVKSGDSLFKIAHDHGTTVKALRAANDLKTDKIKVGQKLKLPAPTAPTTTAPVDATAPTVTPPPAVPIPAPGTAH